MKDIIESMTEKHLSFPAAMFWMFGCIALAQDRFGAALSFLVLSLMLDSILRWTFGVKTK